MTSVDMSSAEIDVLRLLCVACCERPIEFDRWLVRVKPSMKTDESKIIMEYVSTFKQEDDVRLFKDLLINVWKTVGDGDSRLALIKTLKIEQ